MDVISTGSLLLVRRRHVFVQYELKKKSSSLTLIVLITTSFSRCHRKCWRQLLLDCHVQKERERESKMELTQIWSLLTILPSLALSKRLCMSFLLCWMLRKMNEHGSYELECLCVCACSNEIILGCLRCLSILL